jgi:hypothetical protein
MRQVAIILGAVVIACITLVVSSFVQVEAAMPKHGILWDAVVLSQQPTVFQDASATSRSVMQLTKGDSVGVVLKISVLAEDWCRIELPGQTEPVGYIVCRELQLAPSSVGFKGSKANATSALPVSNPQLSTVHPSIQPRALTNIDILDMNKVGISSNILVAKIKSSTCNFDTSPGALQSLKIANLGDNVILAMVEAPIGQPEPIATPSVNTSRTVTVTTSNASTPPPSIAKDESKSGAGSTCVILKRMGPADQITSHMYSFGIRGKQFQFVEGELPKGVTFHGRLTDHDIRIIRDKGGRLFILEPKYSVADLEEVRKGCQKPN